MRSEAVLSALCQLGSRSYSGHYTPSTPLTNRLDKNIVGFIRSCFRIESKTNSPSVLGNSCLCSTQFVTASWSFCALPMQRFLAADSMRSILCLAVGSQLQEGGRGLGFAPFAPSLQVTHHRLKTPTWKAKREFWFKRSYEPDMSDLPRQENKLGD